MTVRIAGSAPTAVADEPYGTDEEVAHENKKLLQISFDKSVFNELVQKNYFDSLDSLCGADFLFTEDQKQNRSPPVNGMLKFAFCVRGRGSHKELSAKQCE